MARITPIRISKNDRQEYARLVRNARAKINRTAKKHGVDLTGEVDFLSLDDFSTRSEFNEWKEKVSSFTNRHNLNYQFVTNDYGVTASKKTINEIERRRKIEQLRAQEEIDRVKGRKVKQGGKAFATVEERAGHLSMPDVTGVYKPKDFDFKEVKNQKRLDEIIEMGKKRVKPDHYEQRKWDMRNNFIESLEEAFDNMADDLIDELWQLTPQDFYFLYIDNEEFDFANFYYEDDEIHMRLGHVGKMMDILKEFQEETLKENGDLKNF